MKSHILADKFNNLKFGTVEKDHYFCSAKSNERLSLPLSIGYCSDISSGIFYVRTYIQLTAVISKTLSALRSGRLLGLATGYDSPFSVYNAKPNKEMKTISLKPFGTVLNTRLITHFKQCADKIAMITGIVFTIILLVAAAVGNYTLLYLSASLALAAFCLADSTPKGGQR